jgi:pimeloyl-ACP methyl ester carboxylesterase
MPELEANAVRLSYDRSGEGPPLVMVAGRGMPRSWWTDDHVAPYTASGYSVLRFDNRGMPPSGSPPEPFAIADLVADTAALLDGLGLSRCVLLGHSMGSCIVQELAHRRPDLVRSAVRSPTRSPALASSRSPTRVTGA